jgi:hypothetical protein
MKKTIAILTILMFPSIASAQLTTRQMRTTGTPTTIPAEASNGTSDSVARVDHTHPCAVASSTQAGCLSSVDWLIFDGKEEPLSFSSGLTRTGNTVSCDDASGSGKGCVTTATQTFAGAKMFQDGVVTATVDAPDESSLRLRALTGGVIIESGTDKSAAAYPITLLPSNDVLYSPSATARTLTLDLATKTAGRAVFEITNSGSVENTYGADLSIPKGDLLIGPLASPTATINVNGEATVYSIAANVWGSHGHTDASSGGTLSASAIASGTLAVARGGTGVSTATSDAVLVGNGSVWQAKVIPDCDAAGSRLRYDATSNSFSCAATEGWTTISAFSNGWDSCTIAPRYRKDLDGRVHLSGCIKSGTRGVTATTLPTGYRPSRTSMFSAVAIGETSFEVSPCAIVVSSTGALIVSSVGCDSTYGIYLDGISFWTD